MTTAAIEPGDGRVPYVQLALERNPRLLREMTAAAAGILSAGQFVLGEAVEEFERRFAGIAGTRHAVGVGSGTDALVLALRALGVGQGDEVLTAPNSFLASASAIVLAGATPRFVDVGDDYNMDSEKVRQAVTSRTKAVIPVHLTGRPARMNEILAVAGAHGLHVVEDASQAAGAKLQGRPVGSFGRMGCFSLHPLKNLAAAGDGGVITTDDDDLAVWLRKARNHGLRDRDVCEFWSVNSRLDAIQAAMLTRKCDCLVPWTARRREIAARYRKGLSGVVETPAEAAGEYAVYHTFVIQADRRDALQAYLQTCGIETKIHYPVPIHLQPAAKPFGYGPGDFPVAERQATRILSLPVFPGLRDDQVDRVIDAIRAFYRRDHE